MLTVTARSSDTTAYAEFSQAVKTVSKEKFNYTYEEEVNTFVANFHDAVSLSVKRPIAFSCAPMKVLHVWIPDYVISFT